MNILAATVLVTATKRQGSILPDVTPFSHITDIRSSTPVCEMWHYLRQVSHIPLTPFGILVKLSLPIAFWLALNVQLSVPVVWRAPLQQYEHTISHYSTCQSLLMLHKHLLYYKIDTV